MQEARLFIPLLHGGAQLRGSWGPATIEPPPPASAAAQTSPQVVPAASKQPPKQRWKGLGRGWSVLGAVSLAAALLRCRWFGLGAKQSLLHPAQPLSISTTHRCTATLMCCQLHSLHKQLPAPRACEREGFPLFTSHSRQGYPMSGCAARG